MNTKLEDYEAAVASPVYAGRSPTCLVAGLPYDDVYRGMQHAKALRNAYFKSLANRYIVDTARRVLRHAHRVFEEFIEKLHRGTFTSII